MAIAQKKKQRHLIQWLPKTGNIQLTGFNTGTVTIDQGIQVAKDRGNSQQVVITAPNGRSASGDLNGGWAKFHFQGDCIGIGLWRRQNTAMPDLEYLDVRVDGKMYRLDNIRYQQIDGSLGTAGELGYIEIDMDLPALPDGRQHTLEVGMFGNPDTTNGFTRNVYIPYLVVDKISGGYPETKPYGTLVDTAIVPTTPTGVPMIRASSVGTEMTVRAWNQIRYQNPMPTGLPQALQTTNLNAIGATVLNVPTTSGMAATGEVMVGAEIIGYASIINATSLLISDSTRGKYGTFPATHVLGDSVTGPTRRVTITNLNGAGVTQAFYQEFITAGGHKVLDFGNEGMHTFDPSAGTRFQHYADGPGVVCGIIGRN